MLPLQVVAGVVWRKGRYLAVQRPKGKQMSGLWEFPGGKIEIGENACQALVRELHEELGIVATAYHPWRETRHSYPNLDVHLFFFMVTAFQGLPRPRDLQRMAWVDPAENVLPFLEADQGIVAELAATFGLQTRQENSHAHISL